MKKNNIHHGFKTFLEALELIQLKGTDAKRYLKDMRLTSQEKKLLAYYFSIRENNFSFSRELIEDKSFDAVPFFHGLKCYFLGLSFVYKADSGKAEKYLQEALPYLSECYNESFIQRLELRTYANLFYAYVNQKKISHINESFAKLSELTLSTNEDKVLFGLIRVCYLAFNSNYSAAEEALFSLEEQFPQMNDIQKMSFLLEKFDFFIKVNLIDKAESVLLEIKQHRTFRLSANYQYMGKLLKFLLHGERIYSYDRDFEEHIDLMLMINVIKALDMADTAEAEKYWMKLSEISPEAYGPAFQYNGDRCLFSLCLEKCLTKKSEVKEGISLEKEYKEKELQLIEILSTQSSWQIKKEELFFALYGKDLQFKDELAALTSLVFKVNTKGEITIKSKKGTYFIAEVHKKSA